MTEVTIKKENLSTLASAFRTVLLQGDCVDRMRLYGKHGKLGPMNLRSIAWKFLFGILDESESITDWLDSVKAQRQKYKELRNTYCNPNKKITQSDPLSMAAAEANANSSDPEWAQYYKDQEVKKLINLDLDRTYQEIDLFLQSKNKAMLANILFIWSRLNDVGYRQGMNELLAVIYLAFYPCYFKPLTPYTFEEYKAFATEEQFSAHAQDLFVYFNNENELEADLFCVFASLMSRGMDVLYNTDSDGNERNVKKEALTQSRLNENDEEQSQTPLIVRCNKIIKEKLKFIDEELYKHFKRIQLNCTIFLQYVYIYIYNTFIYIDDI